jgi:hypothetical protein
VLAPLARLSDDLPVSDSEREIDEHVRAGRVTVHEDGEALLAHLGRLATGESSGGGVTRVVETLRDLLGAKFVAYLSGIESTALVAEWISSAQIPSTSEPARLDAASRVCAVLTERYGPQTLQTWFMGSNPTLAGEAPARG